MKIKNCGFIVVLLSIFLLLLSGPALAAEFSARIVTTYQGQESGGKVYVKGNRIRQELGTGPGARIVIYNAGAKVAWILRPEKKMYLELPITEEMMQGLMQMAQDQASMKPLGAETVNGYATDKYETVFRTNGSELKHHIWIAKKLGMIIKIESLDKSFSREYRDIQEGGVPEAVLTPPPDYQKMGLPGGMPAKP